SVTLYEKLSFNFIRDIAPIAGIVRMPLVMEVNPSVPAATLPDFITYAKANTHSTAVGWFGHTGCSSGHTACSSAHTASSGHRAAPPGPNAGAGNTVLNTTVKHAAEYVFVT